MTIKNKPSDASTYNVLYTIKIMVILILVTFAMSFFYLKSMEKREMDKFKEMVIEANRKNLQEYFDNVRLKEEKEDIKDDALLEEDIQE